MTTWLVIDDLSTGRRQNLDHALANGAQLFEVDVRDRDDVAAAVAESTPS